jgi:ribosomal protein L1
MPTIGKTLGTVLGPRGKMPKPVPPNADISNMTKNLRSTIRLRSKSKVFHTIAGNADMPKEHIAENIDAIKEAVIKLKNDPKLCEELGRNGLLAAKKKYNWEAQKHILIKLYSNF